jgi:cellobiose PTS system EIIB component
MNQLKVLLCCGAGMSSGFLAQRAAQAAKAKGYDMSIEARSQSVVEDYLDDINLLLLGPHYLSHLEEFEEMAEPYHVPVRVIPQEIYGKLDGEKLVEFSMSALAK